MNPAPTPAPSPEPQASPRGSQPDTPLMRLPPAVVIPRLKRLAAAAALLALGACCTAAQPPHDPLPSWHDGPAQGPPDTRVGTFTRELYDQARTNGWTVISMNRDWKRIFAFDRR
jgi:hypothetical protein